MYKLLVDPAGNILDQHPAEHATPAELDGSDGRTWLDSDIRRDIALEYWTGSAWADKTAKTAEDPSWSVWNGSGWEESQTLKEELIRITNIELRNHRDYLLSVSDWTQLADSPLTDTKKAEWTTYRQALRDYPSNNTGHTYFSDLVWPDEPV